MKPVHFFKLLFVALLLAQCTQFPSPPKSADLFENEKNEENEAEEGYQSFFEYSRKAALGDDWQRITNENEENASDFKRSLMSGASSRASFAGGALQGDWYERGGSTVSGDMNSPAFYPATEEVFALSTSGTIYKGGLTGAAWTVQNDTENFNKYILAVINNGGSKRLISAKKDQKIYYSDNDGVNWSPSNGIVNLFDLGTGGKKLVVFNNGNMFYLQQTWLGAPWWKDGHVLYRSTDNGVSWASIQTFSDRGDGKISMWSPYKSNELYVIDNGKDLYSLNGNASALTLLNTNTTLTTGGSYSLTGYQSGGNTSFYALYNSSTLFKSTDNGATWANIKVINPTAWSIGIDANPFVANTLYYGEVEFWKSTDDGGTFNKQNTWQAYNASINSLHADMVSNRFYEKTDGTKFMLIGCHGGIYYMPAPFANTTNLTATGIRSSEYYDVVTIGGTIFGGSQDQGNQRFAGGGGTNIQTATQLHSGDYVRLNTSVNGTKYWHEYPGGFVGYYDNPLVQQNSSAEGTVSGTERDNIQYWSVPTCNWSVAGANSILVGGGVASSGTGSHIVKLTYNGTGTLAEYEYPYDFKANGGGYITALDHSPVDANYMYVGLNNGKFYYSTNAGTNWTPTAGFTGPTNNWIYGGFVHASRLNKNLVFYCGGGGKIYKSINAGAAFSDMSVDLPNTFVSEVALNSNETLLFAATDAGPYVCVLSTGQWYSLTGAATPVKTYTSVEYVATEDVMRFTTFGRGVWDFKITAQPLPISFSHFEAKATDNQQVSVTWKTELESNMDYFEVERSHDGIDFFTLRKINANNKASRYDMTDQNPRLNTTNYYRIKSVEKSGKIEYTNIEAVNISRNGNFVNVYPTLLKNGSPIFVEVENNNQTFSVFDQQGKMILDKRIEKGTNQIEMPNSQTGYYFYAVKDENGRLIKSGKVLMN